MPLKVILRWVLAVFLVGKGFLMLTGIGNHGPAGMGGALFGFSLLVSGVITAAPELVMLACRPMFRFIDSVYGGSAWAKRPPLDYRLADHYQAQLRYEDLAGELERIHSYYPREERPYFDLIELYLGRIDHPGKARHLLRKSRWHLKGWKRRQIRERAAEITSEREAFNPLRW